MTQREGRKVLVIFHEAPVGGATISILRMLPHLEAEGWSFVFWVPRPSAIYDELFQRGYAVDGRPRYLEYSLRSWKLPPGLRRRVGSTPSYLRAFRRFLREQSPDLVHANTIMTSFEAFVAKNRGVPTVIHAHEMLRTNARGRLIRSVVWNRLDKVVAVSKASAARLEYQGRLPEIVYEAAPIPPEAVPIRPDPRPFVVGTVGVTSTRKGTDLFVEAAERLSQEQPGRFKFEILGAPNDALEREWGLALLKRAKAAGIRQATSTNIFESLQAWDAFALPSREDPFPIAMLEAMAAGLPVIGSQADGIPEQLDGGAGIVVPKDDPAALADALLRISESPADDRAALGAAARRRVESLFTVERQVEKMERVYLEALGTIS